MSHTMGLAVYSMLDKGSLNDDEMFCTYNLNLQSHCCQIYAVKATNVES